MANQTLPGFSGKIRGAMSETKYQSRIRNDVYASSRYAGDWILITVWKSADCSET